MAKRTWRNLGELWLVENEDTELTELRGIMCRRTRKEAVMVRANPDKKKKNDPDYFIYFKRTDSTNKPVEE